MSLNLSSAVQNSAPGHLITMFQLDTSLIGGPVMHFTPTLFPGGGSEIVFNGVTYTYVDLDTSGFETNGAGNTATPHIKIANTSGVFQAVLNTYGDLVGCKLIRLRTFDQFLDGGAQADPTAFFGPDIFLVERKVSENPIFIEWELSASIDNQGAMIPKRVVIRDTCTWRYRTWNAATGAFDYSKAQCPYTGSMLDAYDNVTYDTSQDGCGRTIKSCQLRFGGQSAPLPFGGFPGVARFQ